MPGEKPFILFKLQRWAFIRLCVQSETWLTDVFLLDSVQERDEEEEAARIFGSVYVVLFWDSPFLGFPDHNHSVISHDL